MSRILPNFYPVATRQLQKPVNFGNANKPEKIYVGTEETRRLIPGILQYLVQHNEIESINVYKGDGRNLSDVSGYVYTLHSSLPTLLVLLSYHFQHRQNKYHYLSEDGSIEQYDGNNYQWGGDRRYREHLEEHFENFITAIRTGRTEPKLPQWLAEPPKAAEKPVLQKQGIAWNKNYIPPGHLTNTNLQAVEKTLRALRVLATKPIRLPKAWEKHHALPGVELPVYLRLSTKRAGDFQVAADTLKTSLCALGNLNRAAVIRLCEETAQTLSHSSNKFEEVAIKPSLQALLQAAITLNNEKYGSYIEAYRIRLAKQTDEATQTKK